MDTLFEMEGVEKGGIVLVGNRFIGDLGKYILNIWSAIATCLSDTSFTTQSTSHFCPIEGYLLEFTQMGRIFKHIQR